jgi:hypothetical protein
LPVFAYREQLLDTIAHHAVVVVEGEVTAFPKSLGLGVDTLFVSLPEFRVRSQREGRCVVR